MNKFGDLINHLTASNFPDAETAYQKSDKIRMEQSSKKNTSRNFIRCKANIQNVVSNGGHTAFCEDLNRESLDSLIKLGYKIHIDEGKLNKYGCDSVFINWDKS